MERLRLLCLFIIFPLFVATAGESLSLNKALLLARQNNFDVRLAGSERDAAQGNANKTNSVFLPRISVSATYAATSDPLNVFGFKLKQAGVTQSDFNPILLNDPKRFDNYSTKIEFKQPIINFDGFWGRGAAKDALRAVEQKETRTRQYVVLDVKSKYYELVLARQSLDVINASLDAARSNRELAKNYFDQGMIKESDYLFAQVRYLDLESKKTETENAVGNSEAALRFVIGSEHSAEIIPTDTLTLPTVRIDSANIADINDRRPDMLAMQYGVDANQAMVRMNQFKFLPSLNAFGSYEWNDRKLFGKSGTSWMVGAMVTWDIFTGFDQVGEIQKAEANHQSARIELDKARVKNHHDIEAAFRNLESAKKRLSLSQEAIHQSSENFRILSDRYANGLEKTSDLLNAEAALANARLNHLQALYYYSVTVFTIEFLTEL